MEERIKRLEKRVAELEARVHEQPNVKSVVKGLNEALERGQSFNSSTFRNKE